MNLFVKESVKAQFQKLSVLLISRVVPRIAIIPVFIIVMRVNSLIMLVLNVIDYYRKGDCCRVIIGSSFFVPSSLRYTEIHWIH